MKDKIKLSVLILKVSFIPLIEYEKTIFLILLWRKVIVYVYARGSM
jgi:hypothetical protein